MRMSDVRRSTNASFSASTRYSAEVLVRRSWRRGVIGAGGIALKGAAVGPGVVETRNRTGSKKER